MHDARVYIVGGFLGSGKTTAIANAARLLIKSGKKVGVVTNDQGRYLVDTLFFSLQDVPAVEVSGGCFCCNFDDLEERLASLSAAAKPDIIFAESVGSCADVVATVIQPLETISKAGFKPAGFSVFADSRLLNHYMKDGPMPFSEDVVYIFGKQLEEAGQIIINKSDLLEREELEVLVGKVNDRFPDKSVRIQNSLELAEVEEWTKSIEAGEASAPLQPLKNLDYDRYGAGEAELAWLDTEIGITIDHGSVSHVVEELLESIDRDIRSKGWAIGHLKFVLNDGTEQAKISFTTLTDANWKERLPKLGGENLSLLINARVATSADGLKECIGSAINELAVRREFRYEPRFSDSFHPGYPVPTHRVVE